MFFECYSKYFYTFYNFEPNLKIYMPMKKFVVSVLAMCALVGCERDRVENTGLVVVRIRVDIPENPDVSQVKVEWRNRTTGMVYTTVTDNNGVAECEVEPGIYRVTGQKRSVEELENREELFSGSLEEVTVRNIGIDTMMVLNRVQLSRLVVKEIYYAGCYTDEGVPYQNDGYVSLYNNSADTLWLDGICVGIAGPASASAESEWLRDNPELPEVPIYRCGWQFRGQGHDYPLLPGHEVILAVNAVDHTAGEYGHSQSVDLSGADWAFYRSDFNPEFSAITPGVKTFSLFWLNWIGVLPPTFSLGSSGPGLVVYRMEGEAEEYARTHTKYTPSRPEKPSFMYLTIPREWVLDYVECVGREQEVGNKRVPAVLDKSAIFVREGIWSGKALHRKKAQEIDGRIVYQDTNDSANDFYEDVPSLKRK